MAMRKIPGGNIFTVDIADMLDVTDDVALRVHNYIDKNYNLDWSEASDKEIRFYAHLAFENLNENIPSDF